MTQSNDSLEVKINQVGGIIGNQVKDPSSLAVGTASTPLFVDSDSKVAQGAIPFTLPLSGGATVTTATFLNITGVSTGSANTMMTLPLVAGANVTTLTSQGFLKITVADNAGVIPTGDYYIPFGTLT